MFVLLWRSSWWIIILVLGSGIVSGLFSFSRPLYKISRRSDSNTFEY